MKLAAVLCGASVLVPPCFSSAAEVVEPAAAVRRLAGSKPCTWSNSKCGVDSDWLSSAWPTSKTTAMTDYATELETCYALTTEAACINVGSCAWYGASGICRPWARDWKRKEIGLLTTFINHDKCGSPVNFLDQDKCGSATYSSGCSAVPGCSEMETRADTRVFKKRANGNSCESMCSVGVNYNLLRDSICGPDYDNAAATTACQLDPDNALCIAKNHCPPLVEYEEQAKLCRTYRYSENGCKEEDGCMWVTYPNADCWVDDTRLDIVTHAECNIKSLLHTDAECRANYSTAETCGASANCEWEVRENCDSTSPPPQSAGICWSKHGDVVQAVVDTNCQDDSVLSFMQGVQAYEHCAVASTQATCEAVEVTKPACPTPAPGSGNAGGSGDSGQRGSGVTMDAAFAGGRPWMMLPCTGIMLLLAHTATITL